MAEEKLEPLLREGIESGRLPAVDLRTLLIWTSRIVVSLVLMPMPDDEGHEGVRSSVAALFELTRAVED